MKLDNIDPRKIDFGVGVLRGNLGRLSSGLPNDTRQAIEDAITHMRGAARCIEREQRARAKTRGKANKKPFPREATLRLASCAILALDTRGRIGVGSGMLLLRNPKTGKVVLKRWEEGFFDALDAIGVEYDREAYYAKTARKKKKRG